MPNEATGVNDGSKLLLVTGGKNPGHVRDYGSFKNITKAFQEAFIVNLSELSNVKLLEYNAIIIFTSLESADDGQLDRFIKFASGTGKLLVLLHEASIYNRNHIMFNNLVLARFNHHDNYGRFEVSVKPHPLTKNLDGSFYTSDEFYYYDDIDTIKENCEVIMCRNIDGYPIGFVKELNKGSKVIYISLGHDEASIENRNFIQFIENLTLYL